MEQPSWPLNPYISITVNEPSVAYVTLAQDDPRIGAQGPDDWSNFERRLGFVIFGHEGEWKGGMPSPASITGDSGAYRNVREVSGKFNLQPGIVYTVVPSTVRAERDGDFYLNVFSEHMVTVRVQSCGGTHPALRDLPAGERQGSLERELSAAATRWLDAHRGDFESQLIRLREKVLILCDSGT